ncbi:hypothetical protein JHK87_024283 [Glycine soja]|nr:hypothetical protein JHK87_024283 [Glycine soja]
MLSNISAYFITLACTCIDFVPLLLHFEINSPGYANTRLQAWEEVSAGVALTTSPCFEILAQMKNVDVQLKNVIFDVGHTYVIQNFEVEKNIGHYKATRHGFKINFVKETKVTPHEIPKTMYNFTMFDDIECICVTVATICKLVVANRFRVDVRVGQPHESAIFTLWERECYALIKETATKIK